MTNKLFIAASAIAILASTPALADEVKPATPQTEAQAERTADQQGMPEYTSEEVEKGWENTKEAVSETANDISEATKDAYNNIEQALTEDNESNDVGEVKVNMRKSANGIIGQPVYNADGERVAKVNDIILDESGKATLVILGDGDFTGLGKTAAFDYETITQRSEDGDIISSITEDVIDNASPFSYDRKSAGENVKVIPANGYSISKLLDGNLVDPQGNELASVDNIILRNGHAGHVVVGFGDTLGMGGEKLALNYDDVDVVSFEDHVNLQLSANEAQQFNKIKKTKMN